MNSTSNDQIILQHTLKLNTFINTAIQLLVKFSWETCSQIGFKPKRIPKREKGKSNPLFERSTLIRFRLVLLQTLIPKLQSDFLLHELNLNIANECRLLHNAQWTCMQQCTWRECHVDGIYANVAAQGLVNCKYIL